MAKKAPSAQDARELLWRKNIVCAAKLDPKQMEMVSLRET